MISPSPFFSAAGASDWADALCGAKPAQTIANVAQVSVNLVFMLTPSFHFSLIEKPLECAK
jgi:hypothetical protein